MQVRGSIIRALYLHLQGVNATIITGREVVDLPDLEVRLGFAPHSISSWLIPMSRSTQRLCETIERSRFASAAAVVATLVFQRAFRTTVR
ncbi:hypothetical protein V1291_002574 [Nitrobacteraceae bacterium AZCC 1564]